MWRERLGHGAAFRGCHSHTVNPPIVKSRICVCRTLVGPWEVGPGHGCHPDVLSDPIR